jgi:urease beta subunit
MGRRIAGFLVMAQTAVLMIAGMVGSAGAMVSDTCNQEMWVTNGPVYTIVPAGKVVYIGGSFWYVGPYTGSFAPIDKATGSPVTTFPKINGSVCAVCQDGNGGWYVGGDFTTVNGVSRSGIAHIRADGSLDANWNPNADVGGYNGVWALAVSGTTVYVGGTFTSIGGATRNNIAALDATTGTATAWNPNANSGVGALAVSGTTVYAGGNFSSIGGATRNHIAALDSATGTAISWNPNANYLVNVLVLSGSTVYAGGEFTSIGGQPRSCIAALDAATGTATVWNPNATDGYNTRVDALVMNGTTVYAGGIFDSIGGQLRSCIAALDATTGNATAWNPNASGGYLTEVHALAVSGTTVYSGGEFASIGGQQRNGIAALDSATGTATAWNPIAAGGLYSPDVYALAVSGTTVYAGGDFYSIGGQLRSCIAALDAATGTATVWNPNASISDHYTSPYVNRLAVNGTTVYVAGYFDSIGGHPRNHIAALDSATGTATVWNPNASGYVSTLALSGTTVYAGGNFTSIGGATRNRIAALDAATGTATPWNPNVSSSSSYYSPIVNMLALSGTTVYVGGYFDTIGGQPRSHIAALDSATGTATAWNPNASGYVSTLALSGTTV